MSFSKNIAILLEKRDLSAEELAEKIGAKRQSVYDWMRGTMPRKETIDKIAVAFDVKVADLFRDDLNEIILKKGTPESLISEPREKYGGAIRGKYGSQKDEAKRIETKTMFVPLVNQYAYAGYMAGFSDPEYMEELPKVPFEVDHEGHGNYVCFEMRGESMFDGTYQSLLPGDRLLSREIHWQHWRSKFHIKKYRFVVGHKEEGLIVGYISEHDVENNRITVHKLNPEYEDQTFDLNDISQVFNIFKVQRS